jgi:hypothetical protein
MTSEENFVGTHGDFPTESPEPQKGNGRTESMPNKELFATHEKALEKSSLVRMKSITEMDSREMTIYQSQSLTKPLVK